MGSGFESQGAHFTENPADSSESAGFLRSPNFMVLLARGAYYPLCSCRGPVLAELGHPDVAAEDICTSACIGIRGALRSRQGCGRFTVVQCVRPVPSELGRGRLSRFSVLRVGWGRLSPFSLLRGGWCFACRYTKARRCHTTAAGNHFEKSLLQDWPNPRHKLTEILHVLTLLQQANAKTSRNLSIILKRQIKRAAIH